MGLISFYQAFRPDETIRHGFTLSLLDVALDLDSLSSSALASPAMYDLRNPTATMPTSAYQDLTSDYCFPWDPDIVGYSGQISSSSLLGDALCRLGCWGRMLDA